MEGDPLPTLLLATRNPGKVDELRALLAGVGVRVEGISGRSEIPEVEEDAETLAGNALKKASVVHLQTGLPVLADDSGLEVAALDGRPGVHSARYAGPDADAGANCRLLLHELEGVADRSARFRCVIAYVGPANTHLFEGTCEGAILTAAAGQGGFGYDPLFRPQGETRSFAQMSMDDKNAISHRGLALARAADFLRERFGPKQE